MLPVTRAMWRDKRPGYVERTAILEDFVMEETLRIHNEHRAEHPEARPNQLCAGGCWRMANRAVHDAMDREEIVHVEISDPLYVEDAPGSVPFSGGRRGATGTSPSAKEPVPQDVRFSQLADRLRQRARTMRFAGAGDRGAAVVDALDVIADEISVLLFPEGQG